MDVTNAPVGPAPEPQLHSRVTAAITRSFFVELAEVGYGRLTVDSIVRRAGIGKAAIYRRWPTKKDMALDLLTAVSARANEPPDTGSFRGDVVALTAQLAAVFDHPLAGRILPAVAAEAGRDRELEKVLHETVEGPRRQSYAVLVRRGVERGELPVDVDVDLALDVLAGPLYWRLLVRRKSLDPPSLQRLAHALVAAVEETRTGARRDEAGTGTKR